jgi:hypothetical protein
MGGLRVGTGTCVQTHCKEPKPKISNKYSQKRNCAASVLFPHSCVCEQFIYSHDRSAYSAAGNMWTDPENIKIAHRHMNEEIGIEAAQFPENDIHKWDIRCSA